ncbi:MAG: eukaryotic-like serine/threonine-protein kinase [Mycobacterium sp.]|nr:eukaryotic-like serine/threonine-protein kinase [Mycobacterium sp.]
MQAPELLGGRYELRGVLGRGGMAEVRDGWDIRLDRPVAVKLLHPVFTTEPDTRKRFEVEARAAAALNHPHIVSVHDSGEHAGTPYIVMERLSGRTLADVIAQGPLPQPQVRSILDDVLSALAAAHAAGILHRDIKPANILFSALGDVKVADFGIAKSAGTTHTLTGQIVGTMAYLSADRIAGRPACAGDDLYAVGVVGYEALCGRRAFPQENLAELARAVAESTPPRLAVLRPDVDPALAAVIERAMARDPGWRFASADEMRAALAGRIGPPARPPTRILAVPLPDPITMVVPPRRNRSRWWLLAAAVIAVLVAAIAFIVDSASQPAGVEPVTTSTSVPQPTSVLPPPPATTPVLVEEPPPPKKRGENGNGNGHKGGGHGGD